MKQSLALKNEVEACLNEVLKSDSYCSRVFSALFVGWFDKSIKSALYEYA